MIYLNLRTADLRAPEYLACEPISRATWLNVLAYCCEQENGGVLEGAARWGTRQWQQTCGVTREEVHTAAPLLTVQGDNVIVWNFPMDKQVEVQAKREQARSAARHRWDRAPADASRIASRNAERKGKENKVVVGASGDAGIAPRPTTDQSSTDSTEHASEAEWVEKLTKAWPRLDIAAELRAAFRKNPDGFDRSWFETRWLPHAKPRLASIAQSPASRVKVPSAAEPIGWRDLPEWRESRIAAESPGADWTSLDQITQRHLTELVNRRTIHA